MKTSDIVRICIGRLGSLLGSGWIGTYNLILGLACSLPEYTPYQQSKAEQVRQQAPSLRLACSDSRQVLVAVNQCSYIEINKPQFIPALKFWPCILMNIFLLFSFFSFIS